ncbi:hypothetical protein [Tsuneonella rigui]|nr:hypothetical protein [Tsuneonella rigui]
MKAKAADNASTLFTMSDLSVTPGLHFQEILPDTEPAAQRRNFQQQREFF